MPVKIRLTRMGRRKRPFYRIVVAESRAPRDGRFIEVVGFYDPLTAPATIQVKADRAHEWLTKGAQMTKTVKQIFQRSGIFQQRQDGGGGDEGAR